MNSGPAVIVNKGGFLSALVKGLFGTIMVVVICGTALGLYGMRMADNFVGSVTAETLAGVSGLGGALAHWQALPPILAEPLNDRRAFEYRDDLDIATSFRLADKNEDRGSGIVTVEVTNNGSEVVSFLTLRMLVEDDGPEFLERQYTVATPFTCGVDGLRGPLLPGKARRLLQSVFRVVGEPKVTTEVTDVRIWNGPVEPQAKELAEPAPAAPAEPATPATPAGEPAAA